MKNCLTCGPRPTTEFNKHKGRKDGLTDRCRPCLKEWKKSHESTKRYRCKCGETDPDKFYGHKKTACGKCHNQYTKERGQETRLKAITVLGGECILCGYDQFSCSLDFHHVDPTKKDPNYASMRNWEWERVEKEIQRCVLLCKNCHQAVHGGHLQIK